MTITNTKYAPTVYKSVEYSEQQKSMTESVGKEIPNSTNQMYLGHMNNNVLMALGTIRKIMLKKMNYNLMLAIVTLSVTLMTNADAGNVPDKVLQYIANGYYRKALTIIEPLAKEHSQDAEVQCRYGQALAGIGKFDEGIAALKTAILLEPDNGIYHRLLGEAYGMKAKRVSGVFSVFGIFSAVKSSMKEFQLAVDLAPQDLKAHLYLAMYYIEAPGFLGGSFDKAHEEQKIIAKLDPVKGLQVLAKEAIKKEDISAGERLLKEAVAKDQTTGSLMELGLFYTEVKRFAEAFKIFREIKAKDPKAYTAWYQIGRVAGFSKTNYEEGIESLKQYIAFDDLPDNVFSLAWAHFRLGNIYEHQGNADLALAEYQLANTLNDGNEDLKSKLDKAISNLE